MPHPIIEVHDLSKCYRIGVGGAGQFHTLRDRISGIFHRQEKKGEWQDFWALKDVSFDVQPGGVLGIIGANGAGKSTLLKILSRITEPTAGEVVLRGRVASLLEVGTGFHPELTGRENIFLNGVVLGMKRAEVAGKFDEIVAFSGVEKFLDTPVKRYSSGMYVRLAFAVAAHLDPEILIVDEVLAVGDAEFQKKCLGKMREVASGGRTVVFVSHNLSSVMDLCPRSLLLQSGSILAVGDSRDVIARYLGNRADVSRPTLPVCKGPVTIESLNVTSPTGETLEGEEEETPLRISLGLKLEPRIREAALHIGIYGGDERLIALFHSDRQLSPARIRGGSVSVSCLLPSFPLAGGDYTFNLAVKTNEGVFAFPQVAVYRHCPRVQRNLAPTKVIPLLELPGRWSLDSEEERV